jgi:hypothetical protein
MIEFRGERGELYASPFLAGPLASQVSCTGGTGSFAGLQRPGCGVNHPPPSNAKAKEKVQLYSPFVSTWQIIG